jgi:hypothetical protein
MLSIKDHGKYTDLVIAALTAYNQLYAQYRLTGFEEYDRRYKAMIELEEALMDIEPDAANAIKAMF